MCQRKGRKKNIQVQQILAGIIISLYNNPKQLMLKVGGTRSHYLSQKGHENYSIGCKLFFYTKKSSSELPQIIHFPLLVQPCKNSFVRTGLDEGACSLRVV